MSVAGVSKAPRTTVGGVRAASKAVQEVDPLVRVSHMKALVARHMGAATKSRAVARSIGDPASALFNSGRIAALADVLGELYGSASTPKGKSHVDG